MDDRIWVETMVASRTGAPAVILRWYDHSGEFSPAEARAFALQVLEAAAIAENDAFLVHFMAEKMRCGRQEQATMLQFFREWREEQEKKNGHP